MSRSVGRRCRRLLPRPDRPHRSALSLPFAANVVPAGTGLGDRAILFATQSIPCRTFRRRSPLKTMMRRVHIDREENNAPGSVGWSCERQSPREGREERQAPIEPVRRRARPYQGRAPARGRGGRQEAASLDTTCARRRQHPAVGARESLRRGQTREMTLKEESVLDRQVCACDCCRD